jgi:hypothetical protein
LNAFLTRGSKVGDEVILLTCSSCHRVSCHSTNFFPLSSKQAFGLLPSSLVLSPPQLLTHSIRNDFTTPSACVSNSISLLHALVLRHQALSYQVRYQNLPPRHEPAWHTKERTSTNFHKSLPNPAISSPQSVLSQDIQKRGCSSAIVS